MLPLLTWDLYANPIGVPSTPWERNLSRLNVTEATFGTIADGGFGQATLSFDKVSLGLMEEALNDWKMKRVVVSDSAGNIPYEGFIAEINATYGHHVYTWSIDPFFNRAIVVYDTTVKGATVSKREFVNETDIDATYSSQTSLGIKEEWLDYPFGVTIATQANAYGKQRMKRVLKPLMSSLHLGTGSAMAENNLTLTIMGAYGTLLWRKTTAKATSATEIATLLATDLTSGTYAQYLTTSDLTQLATTGRSVTYNTHSSPIRLQDWIHGLLTGGDNAGRRLFFQVGAGRIPVLYSRRTAPVYFSQGKDWRILNSDRGVIPTYMVAAGGYVQADDLTDNLDEPSDVIGRVRASLIEQTQYDALTDSLDIDPPADLTDTRRLLARYARQSRKRALG